MYIINNFYENFHVITNRYEILEYTIDGDRFYNELKFLPNDNGNDITIIPSGDFQIVYNKYNLKSLIVGFPQARGNDAINQSEFISNKIKSTF
jgi:hypothetical protein